MRTTVPTVSFLLSAAALALAPLAAQAAMYQATCQGQTVSASSTAAFGPKCTNVRLIGSTPTPAPVVTPTKPAPAPVDPYRNLYTVQGWANAYKTNGLGTAGNSPYDAAAVNKQVVYDANGNFLQARNLGTTTRIGQTTYVQQGSTTVNGVTVYTYVKK
ncbi:MAG TPA: hypothetical protein PK306_25060 [Aquabacterium sp.]|nr:hypothetical protein [Aquabacterium sp.]HQC98979.1 hypothetical protein [Aquabacterium sp.]